jgi:branched-subunit amino acid aminotransferase/4-amino-4-deoxychorismate lyase
LPPTPCFCLQHAQSEPYLTVERIERRTFSTQELLAAQEAFAISTRMGVVGISHFDEQQIGTHDYEGEAGSVSMALHALLEFERQPKQGSPLFTEVPYGYLTGMKAQLV